MPTQQALFGAGRIVFDPGKVVVGEGPKGDFFRDFSVRFNDRRPLWIAYPGIHDPGRCSLEIGHLRCG